MTAAEETRVSQEPEITQFTFSREQIAKKVVDYKFDVSIYHFLSFDSGIICLLRASCGVVLFVGEPRISFFLARLLRPYVTKMDAI